VARVSIHVDEYHGVQVADPYRWLEDPDSYETRTWIEAQNAHTNHFLSGIYGRSTIRERLTELWDYERYGVPFRRAGRTFFSKNDGLQDQSVLYVVDHDGAEPRVLLDPNTLSEDNTVALAGYTPSWDGRYLAYALSDGGSDWRTWHVKVIDTGEDLPDVVTRNKFGGMAWDADSTGLFYTRYDAPEEGTELQAMNAPPDIAYHALGTDESADGVIVRRPEEEGVSQGFRLTEDRSALVVTRWQAATRNNDMMLVPLPATPDSERTPLVEDFDAQYSYVGDDGATIWVRTNLEAPRWRVVGIPMGAPERENWVDVIPEGDDAIQGVSSVGGRLIVTRMKDATSRVSVHWPDGSLERELGLPGLGSCYGFGGEPEDQDTFYSFTSFTHAPTIYRYHIASGESSVYREPELDFDAGQYDTYQVFYRSMDGKTRVPMFITHRRDLELTGDLPTYLYGYGGFNISLTPSFSIPNLVWLEMGGVLAVPNLRGGGEYGEDWHEAGTKLNKQNVFDDFEAAARWLVRNEYTTPRKLAIGGASNGGLLVGACITQNPWLYGAALPAVGVMDMLRYHEFTIGWAWAGDYGTSDDPAEFEALLAYSPLHNIEPGKAYPATLVTTADHDDRVVPAHSFKFAAALQAAQGGDEPILIRIETRAGHGAGKPTAKRIEEATDRWAFLTEVLDFGQKEVDRGESPMGRVRPEREKTF
jgi:prolyl oligopeptidase